MWGKHLNFDVGCFKTKTTAVQGLCDVTDWGLCICACARLPVGLPVLLVEERQTPLQVQRLQRDSCHQRGRRHLCWWVLTTYIHHTHTPNHFTALWTLSGTIWVSQYRKVHFAIFWIFWYKMKITQADAPTIRMDCHPSRLIGAPISTIPTIFTPDALPDTTLPI